MNNDNSVLVLAETRGRRLHPVNFEMLAWGSKLAGQLEVPLDCAVLGSEVEEADELIKQGADRVFLVSPGSLPGFLATPLASLLVDLIREIKPAIVIAPATTSGRTLLPIAAARLATGLTADCTELSIDPKDNLLLQTRPAIGGNIMATIKTPLTRPQMATVRPRTIRPLTRDESKRGDIIFKQYGLQGKTWPEKLLAFHRDENSDNTLEGADIVVAGGKGMKNKDNFRLLEDLAGVLGAGLGATRVAVEAGWAPFSRQIGLTGKTVAPKLYIGAGVAGKIQHLAGMITSEYIIAINEDKDAPIFKVADLGIIGDAPTMAAKLTAALREFKRGGSAPNADGAI